MTKYTKNFFLFSFPLSPAGTELLETLGSSPQAPTKVFLSLKKGGE